MGGFNIFWGNRLETLAETLVDVLRAPPFTPLQSEIIVVQNKGMQHWISLRIAEMTGVCANVRFPFPRSFLDEVIAGLTGISTGDTYDPDILTWRIMGVLPSCSDDSRYTEIQNYLAGDFCGLKAFQFSSMLALAYDRYIAYRPEMIVAWEKGDRKEGAEQWQAELWRKMALFVRSQHSVGLRTALADKLNTTHGNLSVPQRVSLFGISTLPPLYLDMFRLLSGIMEVNGFFLNPSREFWSDILSEQEIGRTVRRVREKTVWKLATGDDLYLWQGNNLLASFGRAGRDFYSQLLQFPAQITDIFSDPQENTLLSIVQSDILNLRDRGNAQTPAVVILLPQFA
jgi:exodeoxyribonuclease V gamma subunit